MTNLKNIVAAEIAAKIVQTDAAETVQTDAAEIAASLKYPPNAEMGDLTLPCFKLSKILRKSPAKIAEELAAAIPPLSLGGYISRVCAVNGYLNIYLSDECLTREITGKILAEGECYGSENIGRGEVVVLDYSSPNVAKPFHIGHLGSTVIGHSLRKIHEFMGYKCVGINHLGDWGTQFGKMIAAFKKWGDKETIERDGIDGITALYVKFHAEAEIDPSLDDLARAEFSKLENGDEDNTVIWRWFIEISLREYETTYKQLGITFESYLGESFYVDKVPAQAEVLRGMGLLKIDGGASIVDLSADGMPPCLILKSDGSTIYHARDIAAAVYRRDTYNFNKCIYVTASEQILHFRQLFRVIALMGHDWADKLVHVPYGLISINGAKLATRTGNVVRLRDLFAQAVGKAAEIIEEKNPALEDKNDVAEAVGVGAIIFNYLLPGRTHDTNFMLDDALSFEGNTGPYAQYTYARTRSVAAKAGGQSQTRVDSNKAGDGITAALAPEERELLAVLARFGEVVRAALDEYEPSLITRYILDVCASYNRFYNKCPILTAPDRDVRAARLRSNQATGIVLRTALGLICMRCPEKI